MKDDQVRARIEPIDPEAGQDITKDGKSEYALQPCKGVIEKVAISWKNGRLLKPFVHRLVYLFLAFIMLMVLSVLLGVLLSRAHSKNSSVDVDLGYARYRGISSDVTGISQWLGMRYAEPPLGNLRFRAAQDPLNTTGLQSATEVSTKDVGCNEVLTSAESAYLSSN